MISFLAHSCFKEAKIKQAFCGGGRKRNALAGLTAVWGQQALVRERMTSRQEYSCGQ